MEQNTTQNKQSIRLADMLTKPETGQAVCLAVFCFLSYLILPLTDRPTLATVYLAAVAIFFYLLTHSVRAILCYALPALLLYGAASLLPELPDPILLPAAFTAFVMGGAAGGFLLIHYHDLKKHPYVLAIPVAAYVLSAWITSDPLRGLIALLPFALSIVSALCVLLLFKRTDATLLLAATLAAVLLAAGLLTFAVMGLGNSPLEFVTTTVRNGIVTLFADMEALYAEMGMSLGLTDVAISNTATLLINLLPGIFISTCAITAFLAYRLLLQLLMMLRSLPRLPLRLSGFTVSRMCAIVFLAVLILSLFANYDTVTFFGTVCDNLALVLQPALALVGVTSLLPRGTARSCLSTCILLLIAFLAFSDPMLALELAAVTGAVCILLAKPLKPSDPNNKGVK